MERSKRSRPNAKVKTEPAAVECPAMELPDEMLLEIFGYLSAKDIANCCQVCTRWNVLGNSTRIWKHLLAKDFPTEQGMGLEYKEAYIKGQESVMNWRRGCFLKMDKENVACLKFVTLGNGGVMIGLRVCGMISVFNLNSQNHRQDISQPKFERRINMEAHGNFLGVMCIGKTTKYLNCYEWRKTSLKFMYHLYTDPEGGLDKKRPIVAGRFKLYSLGGVLCTINDAQAMSFWSMENRRQTYTTRLDGPVSEVICTKWSVFTMEGWLVQRDFSGQIVHVFESPFAFTLTENQAFTACCNFFSGLLWNKSSTITSSIPNCQAIVLHPDLPFCCFCVGYSCHCLTSKLTGRNLSNGSDVWTFNVMQFRTAISIDRYHLLVITAVEALVVDWRTGDRVLRLDETIILTCFSSKVLVTPSIVYNFISPNNTRNVLEKCLHCCM